jgi:Tfp pilus assembly protein PilF
MPKAAPTHEALRPIAAATRTHPVVALLIALASGCRGGGSAEQRPSASAADARLAEPESRAPAASALVQQGEAKLGQNDPAGAKGLFEQALAADAKDARAALDLGIASELLGDAAGAEAAYRRALTAQPDFGEAQNNLGVMLRDGGQLEEAIALLKRAAASSPNSAAAHQNLALAYEDKGRLPDAAREYARALEIEPKAAMTRANYGLLLLKQQQRDAALRELSQALDDAQGDRPALLAIGNGLRRAGDPAAALRAMEGAVAAGGEPTPALLSELALAQRTGGKREEAIATLEKVLKQDENYATAHYLLANMLASDQRFADAKKHYERYLKLAPNGSEAEKARERLAVIQKRK